MSGKVKNSTAINGPIPHNTAGHFLISVILIDQVIRLVSVSVAGPMAFLCLLLENVDLVVIMIIAVSVKLVVPLYCIFF